MKNRVIAETTLTLLMRSRATIMPKGSENSRVRKKMAQVLPRPSLIFMIMVIKDIGRTSVVSDSFFIPTPLRGGNG